jgi:GH15 family glucan-1,4-alpha-glucosidase
VVATALAASAVQGGVVAPAPRPGTPRPVTPRLATSAEYRGTGVRPQSLRWLALGRVPAGGTRWADMARYATIDLGALTPRSNNWGGPVGGAGEKWGYTWPRDAAFAAAALAATGHRADAHRVLAFLQRVQEKDGGFEARYLLDGRGAPDDRPRQSDGAGWALWALDQVIGREPNTAALAEFRPLLDRATRFARREVPRRTGLPRPSPDYWEAPETRLTLGTAAPLLAGLQASARVYTRLGEADRARWSGASARRLEAAVVRSFGPGGYQRYARSGGVDAAVCFLLPPFVSLADPAPVVAAWERYQIEALRPGGGLAPGAGWRADGVSWTPETALVALTAVHLGRRRVAERWLDWLDRHRTPWGSVPEKVLPDGSPAGPAPLAWTAALVVLTTRALAAGGPASG